MKQWYSAFELAGLSGLPALPNNITRKAKAEQWQSRQRIGRGGGKEYAYNSLPKLTQTALIDNAANQKLVNLGTALSKASSIVSSPLQQVKPTSEQRIDAWLAILRAYEHWSASHKRRYSTAEDGAQASRYSLRSSLSRFSAGEATPTTISFSKLGLCLPAQTLA
jgi:Mu DNA-binding domain